MRKVWTDTEVNELTKLYPETVTEVLAKRFNCSITAVYNKATSLGIKKTERYLKVHGNRLDGVIGTETRFKKGQISHNKGKKMDPAVYKAAEPTMFKKGHVPHNAYDSDGVITVRRNKHGVPYQFIRISLGNWVPLKNHIWEQHNGPVPKNHLVRFINGNTMDCRIENLECISRKENMSRNTIHNYPEEIKDAMRAVGKLNKTIRDYGKKQDD